MSVLALDPPRLINHAAYKPAISPAYSPCVSPPARAVPEVPRKALVAPKVKPSVPPPREVAPPLPDIHSGSFIENFRAALGDIDLADCDAHGENAFFVCDLAEVWRQHQRWKAAFGTRVEPFYAVKCNPDPTVLRLLAAMGLGFDCASQPEISAVLALPGSIPSSQIIYANPCKAASFIRHAAANGIDMMTFDNADELAKIKKYHPRARMVLRILTDDSGSLCRLGTKFGAPLGEVRSLLRKAKALEIEVIGVSFHCGSGCTNPTLFGDAVKRASWAFDVGKEEGFTFDILDIGGGFENHNFEDIAAVLKEAIAEQFPVTGRGKDVRIIAEPGRYYVSTAFQLATNIIARRQPRRRNSVVEKTVHDAAEEDPARNVMYYVNDGVYGAFNCVMFDHQVVFPHVLTLDEEFQEDLAPQEDWAECSVWGPTCDSIDLISPKARLPTEQLGVGDWLRWENMGAYTICAASQFNGFKRSEVRYTIDAHGEAAVEETIAAILSHS